MFVILYEYVRGGVSRQAREEGPPPVRRGILTEWMAQLKDKGNDDYAHMEHALDRLGQAKPSDLPGILRGTTPQTRQIYKLQLGGKVRLRPLWCRGPMDKTTELTFLFPAYERNGVFDPPDAPGQAENRRLQIIGDPTKRRLYERA